MMEPEEDFKMTRLPSGASNGVIDKVQTSTTSSTPRGPELATKTKKINIDKEEIKIGKPR